MKVRYLRLYTSRANGTPVISHPMDFQTMLKKVKSKSYRSKREFKDDLDLIWSNCLTYNATEVRCYTPLHATV